MYRIDELEDAIVAAAIVAGYDAKALNDAPEEKLLEKETGTGPKVFVVFQSAKEAGARTTLRKGMDFYFRILVAARNLRGSSAAARGDVSSTGIYNVLDGLRTALGGNSLGLDAQPMEWISETAQRRAPNLSVYIQEWNITVFD